MTEREAGAERNAGDRTAEVAMREVGLIARGWPKLGRVPKAKRAPLNGAARNPPRCPPKSPPWNPLKPPLWKPPVKPRRGSLHRHRERNRSGSPRAHSRG